MRKIITIKIGFTRLITALCLAGGLMFISPAHSSAGTNTVMIQMTDSTDSFARVILYHPAKILGRNFYYDVYFNDSMVYSADWGSADTVKLTDTREVTIWAKTKEKESIKFTPVKGNIYFLRCGMRGTQLTDKPILEFIDPIIARKEIEKLK